MHDCQFCVVTCALSQRNELLRCSWAWLLCNNPYEIMEPIRSNSDIEFSNNHDDTTLICRRQIRYSQVEYRWFEIFLKCNSRLLGQVNGLAWFRLGLLPETKFRIATRVSVYEAAFRILFLLYVSVLELCPLVPSSPYTTPHAPIWHALKQLAVSNFLEPSSSGGNKWKHWLRGKANL